MDELSRGGGGRWSVMIERLERRVAREDTRANARVLSQPTLLPMRRWRSRTMTAKVQTTMRAVRIGTLLRAKPCFRVSSCCFY